VNPNTTFRIFTTLAELPKNWDDLATTNIFLTRNYLRVLEASAPSNMICYYIGLYQNEQLVGIALSQFLDLNSIRSFGERDHCFKTQIRNFVFKNFCSRILFIGNNMLTGQNAYCFNEKIIPSEGLLLIEKAVAELQKQFALKNLRIHLTVYKDFNPSETVHFNLPEFKPFFAFSTQPNMVFQLKKSWLSIDDYVADLNKKYRDQYKRARKKALGISKRKLTLEEICFHKNTINQLYHNVAEKAPFNTFFLPDDHFETLKAALSDQFLFYGYFIDEKLIGFNTLIKNGSDMDTYFLGYDSEFQQEKMLYLNMLYDMVGYSIKKRFKQITFARTALEIKSSVGAKPEEMIGFIKHQNPLINQLIAPLFRYFEPDNQWNERNPFK
jgi:predicted N-acyltransferase